jgi:hypothetical protein
MNPKVQMVIGIVLGVVLLIEGSSLFTAPSGPSPTRAFRFLMGITILIGAPLLPLHALERLPEEPKLG